MMNNKFVRFLVDSLLIVLFLSLLALPLSSIGLFTVKDTNNTNVEVLGKENQRFYKIQVRETREATQSTNTPLRR